MYEVDPAAPWEIRLVGFAYALLPDLKVLPDDGALKVLPLPQLGFRMGNLWVRFPTLHPYLQIPYLWQVLPIPDP